MKPLETIVGVQRTSRSLRRIVMLPSLAAAKPRAYRRRPISQICSFSLYSFMSIPFSQPAAPARVTLRPCWRCGLRHHHNLIQQTRTVRVDRLALWVERRRRLAAFAERDLAPDARAEIVEHHEVFTVRPAVAQRGEAERHRDHPAGANHARMHARQRHRADHLTDAHGR